MADITASMVSELRQRTGAGMMDCKKALVACDGDMDKAAEELRKVGLAKAAGKADRLAKDGLIRCYKVDDRHGALAVVNCETDFVARNDQFQELAKDLAFFFATAEIDSGLLGRSLKGEALESVKSLNFRSSESVGDALVAAVAVIRENIQLGALAIERSEDPKDFLQDYMHATGRVASLVCLSTGHVETHANPRFREVARDIAMQVASGIPAVAVAVSRDSIDPAVVEKERNLLMEQALGETPGGPNFKGDPKEIAEKKVTGRLNKFFEEVALLDQPFIRDEKSKVSDVIKQAEKDVEDTITIARFHRFELGG
jgi:elongation factor Ts